MAKKLAWPITIILEANKSAETNNTYRFHPDSQDEIRYDTKNLIKISPSLLSNQSGYKIYYQQTVLLPPSSRSALCFKKCPLGIKIRKQNSPSYCYAIPLNMASKKRGNSKLFYVKLPVCWQLIPKCSLKSIIFRYIYY